MEIQRKDVLGTGYILQVFCDECGKDAEVVVEVSKDTCGPYGPYKNSTNRLCADCLRAALELIIKESA